MIGVAQFIGTNPIVSSGVSASSSEADAFSVEHPANERSPAPATSPSPAPADRFKNSRRVELVNPAARSSFT